MLNKKILLSALILFSSFVSACSNTSDEILLQSPEQLSALSTVENKENFTAVNVMNFSQVDDILYRGGVPDEDAMKQLKKMGIKTIVNLRGAGVAYNEPEQEKEEKAMASKMKFNYVNLPMAYDKPVSKEMIKKFFDTVSDERKQPVYIHCYHGRDRTGTMVALYKIKFAGVEPKSALEEMKKFGFSPKDFPALANQVLKAKPSTLP